MVYDSLLPWINVTRNQNHGGRPSEQHGLDHEVKRRRRSKLIRISIPGLRLILDFAIILPAPHITMVPWE